MTSMGGIGEVTRDLADLLDESEDARRRGDYVIGVEICSRAIALAEEIADRHGQAVAHRLLAQHLTNNGDFERAIASCEQARACLMDCDDPAENCRVALTQAFALNELGLSEEALDELSIGRDIAERLRDRGLLYWVHNRIGVVYDSMAERRQARDFMLNALSLAEAVDDEARFSILNNLVDNAMWFVPELREEGKWEEANSILATATEHADRALALAESAAQPYRTSLALGNLGMIQALSGQYLQAMGTLDRARELAAANGYRSLELSARHYAPLVLLMQGEGETLRAIDLLEDVLARAEEFGEQPVQLAAIQMLAEAHERVSQFQPALRRFKEYHAMEQQVRSARSNTKARILAHQVELEQARLEAEDARAQSAVDRAHSEQLEADKIALQLRTRELEATAHSDSLTGIGNRRHVTIELSRMFEQSTTEDRGLCVALLDIDHFKRVNDTFGHAVGDQVLVRVAQLIVRHSRVGDLVSRYGGEEFLLAFSDIDAWSATRMCERLRESIEVEDWSGIVEGLSITVSAGVCSRSDSRDMHEMIERADQQLYRAKQGGRNRVKQRVA